MQDNEIRKLVRERYGKIANPSQSSCCGTPTETVNSCGCGTSYDSYSKTLGYTEEDLKLVPDGANLGLGCGNPTANADLKEGEIILDLGSGAGFDCFIAAKKVGNSGKVIGVDMTPSMIDKARENANKGNIENVEFRLGEIENLPVADNTVDVIISNCVINLSPDKERVYKEAFRVLKPGGRIIVSDIVLPEKLPPEISENADAYAGCVAGAMLKEDYLEIIDNVGFNEKSILEESYFPISVIHNGSKSRKKVISMKLKALKPI